MTSLYYMIEHVESFMKIGGALSLNVLSAGLLI